MNKNTLNAQRLLQYFRKDWSENAAQLYYYFIIPYGIMTLLFIWMDFTKTHSVVVALEQVRQGMETDNNSYQLIMENALSGKDDCWFSIVFTAVLCFDFFMAFAGSTFFKTSKYRKDYITDLTFPVSNDREVYCEMVQNLHHILPYLLFSHRIGRLHPYRFHPFPLS